MSRNALSLPSARYVGPDDPDDGELRTAAPDYQGGRIYPSNPDAHAKLREFWQAQLRKRQGSNHKETIMARKDKKVLSPEQLAEAARRKSAGEALEAIAPDFGMGGITLAARLREAGYATNRRARAEQESDVEDQAARPLESGTPVANQGEAGDVDGTAAKSSAPDLNGLLDFLLKTREQFRQAGGDIEGTLCISGPVAITIDL